MDCDFEFVLLDTEMVNEFLRALHRPEPSGYGTLPDKSMNVAWGVFERNTGITLTKGYEPGRKEWKGRKGVHTVMYDVMSREGCFCVICETNANGDNVESAQACIKNTELFTDKYSDAVKKAILFYNKEGIASAAFEAFTQRVESSRGMPLEAYGRAVYKEAYDEWDRKWK